MKYIDADKLIAEIERLCAEHTSRWETDEVAIVLDKLEDFIDSLQQEQPEVDLEKELEAFLCNYEEDGDAISYDIAHHFYELGKKQ